jgi:transcriptional regulator of nitric oxide reductase
VPGVLGSVCVVADACIGDINANGFVDPGDFAILRQATGAAFPDENYNVLSDLNANGFGDPADFAILRPQVGTACPACP